MVKYGPSLDLSPAERLVHFAHEAGQDGARHLKERQRAAAAADQPWAEGEVDWMDATDPLAIPIPPSDEEASGSGSQVGEPSLSQIMVTIKSCHASLSTQLETIRVYFALLKDHVRKVRDRVTTAEQRISAVEDDLTPNNLRFLGFLKGTEGKQPEEFLISCTK